MSLSVNARADGLPYTVTLSDGSHRWLADVPAQLGGEDAGPAPHELLLSALGACTAITLGMYARRKNLDLQGVDVTLDIAEEIGRTTPQTRIVRVLSLRGTLSDDQRQRLLEIADACPIHRLLVGEIAIETQLMP